MRELLNTLYVQTQGTYLRLQGETVVAEVERVEKLTCLRTFLSRFSWVIVVLIKHKRRPA